MNAPATHKQICDELKELFEFSQISTCELVYDRYRCLNYKIVADNKEYFLKQYKGRGSDEVFETKFAEHYFHNHDLPVVLPLADAVGRPAFTIGGDWYSLFPFIEAQQPDPTNLSDAFLSSLGETLARLHRAGSLAPVEGFRRLKLWNIEHFIFEMVDLKRLMQDEMGNPRMTPQMIENMQAKIDFVQTTNVKPSDFHLPFDCLLHGDPIYQNTFTDDQDNVIALFDLEDACVGPRAYELGRAIMINCFDDGWGDEQMKRARVFLAAYDHVFPIGLDELHQGLYMYLVKNAHKLWFEVKRLFDENDETRRCYESHARRVRRLSEDWLAFCKKIHPRG